MKRTIIESPYSGNVTRNVEYLKRCRLDSLERGEAPFASHHAYSDVLADSDPVQRALGMEAGFAWMAVAQQVAVYVDYDISDGMRAGIAKARELGIYIPPHRRIGKNLPKED